MHKTVHSITFSTRLLWHQGCIVTPRDQCCVLVGHREQPDTSLSAGWWCLCRRSLADPVNTSTLIIVSIVFREIADIFPSKTTISAPCVIPRNFPWDGFPESGKPLTGSCHCAALSRACCNSSPCLVPLPCQGGSACPSLLEGCSEWLTKSQCSSKL